MPTNTKNIYIYIYIIYIYIFYNSYPQPQIPNAFGGAPLGVGIVYANFRLRRGLLRQLFLINRIYIRAPLPHSSLCMGIARAIYELAPNKTTDWGGSQRYGSLCTRARGIGGEIGSPAAYGDPIPYASGA